MLTSDEMEAMRAVQSAAMPDSCTVKRLTVTSDGAGGQTDSWDTSATVNCRLGRLGSSGEERIIADRLAAVTPVLVTLPSGTDVGPHDRIEVDSRTFEVVAVLATGVWETARRVVCVEVQ